MRLNRVLFKVTAPSELKDGKYTVHLRLTRLGQLWFTIKVFIKFIIDLIRRRDEQRT